MKKLLYLYNDGHRAFPDMVGDGFNQKTFEFEPDDDMTQADVDALNQQITDVENEYYPKQSGPDQYGYIQVEDGDFYDYDEEDTPRELDEDEIEMMAEIEIMKKTIKKLEKQFNDDDANLMFKLDLKSVNELKKEKEELSKTIKERYAKQDEVDGRHIRSMTELEKAQKHTDKLIIKYRTDKYKKLKTMENVIKDMDKINSIATENITKFLKGDQSDESLTNTIKEIKKVVKTDIPNFDINKFIYSYVTEAITNFNNDTKISRQEKQESVNNFYIFLEHIAMRAYPKTKAIIEKHRNDQKIENKAIDRLIKEYNTIKKNIEESKPLAQKLSKDKISLNFEKKKLENKEKELKEYKKGTSDGGAEEKKVKPKKIKKEKMVEEYTPTEQKINKMATISLTSLDSIIPTSDGPKLESFLTKSGSSILQRLTGDYSKVHNNDVNPLIPDVMIQFTPENKDSLRKGATIDLYNDNNLFEIKNYKYISLKGDIPIQLAKLEGTSIFTPYYLSNGNIYNIELNVVDPTTGKLITKYIYPENENGREYYVIYRLSNGLYKYNPMEGNEMSLKKTKLKTAGGMSLYLFDGSSLKTIKDMYGNDALKVNPDSLRKIVN